MTDSQSQPTPAELMRVAEATRSDVANLRTDLRRHADHTAAIALQSGLTAQQLADGRAAHDRDVASLQQRIEDLEDWQTWSVRLVVGFVILAVLGVIIATAP